MAASLLYRINFAIQRLEQTVSLIFGRGFPPEAFCIAGLEVNKQRSNLPAPKFSLKEIFQDGFLWAVPKHRRSLERRHKRKYGSPEYQLKILQPKTYLRTCNVCGDDYELGVLCPTCYKKVMDETKEMQTAIQDKLGLEPVEKEIVVVYNDEKSNQSEEWEGKRIIEMEKPRPAWFSKNLLQKTTQQPATTTDVKPSDLG